MGSVGNSRYKPIGIAATRLIIRFPVTAESKSATMQDNPVTVLFTGFNSYGVSHYTI